jgi:glycosyltransferase involved in cell wall biosynthesis
MEATAGKSKVSFPVNGTGASDRAGADQRRSVLVVAFHYPPEAAAGGARPARFARYLPEFGYNAEIITAAGQIAPHPGIHVVPAPTMYPDKYTVAGAVEIGLHKLAWPTEFALLWANPASRCARQLIERINPVAVISTAPPLNTHLAALQLKRRYGLPWIADFRDPMASNPFRKFGKLSEFADGFAEKIIFRHADAVIMVTDVMANEAKARYPQWAHKVHLLWNGFDPAEDLLSSALPSRPYRVLMHVGSLYGMRHPMPVLKSMRRLIESGRLQPGRLRLQLIGHIAVQVLNENRDAMSYLEQHQSLTHISAVPRSEALRFMGESDSLLLLDNHEDQDGYAVPSKLYEYIRVGRPILALTRRDSPVDRILRQSGVPYCSIYTDDAEPEIDAKLIRFIELPSSATPPNDWFMSNFDGRRQTGALAALLNSLVERTGTPPAQPAVSRS